MEVHVLCPFYRKNLYKTLLTYYEPMKIIFHPICYPNDFAPFENNKIPWVKPYLCTRFTDWCIAYQKVNCFLENNELIDEDYYGFVGDDDMFEPGFFDELKKQTTDVVYNSSFNGDHTPTEGIPPASWHPPVPLIMAHAGDIRVCNIGTSMFWVKGKTLRGMRLGESSHYEDGIFAVSLLSRGTITYLTNSFSFGNYFQPGRFNHKGRFFKPTWELPKIIP